MNKNLAIFALTLLVILGFSDNIKTQATNSLQSTGKIIINNPQTNQQEIIFDAQDQTLLRNDIITNSLEINNIANTMNKLPEFIIDESTGEIIGYKTEAGADTVFPFKGKPMKTQSVTKTWSSPAQQWIRGQVFIFSELTEIVGLVNVLPQGPAFFSIAGVSKIEGNQVTVDIYCPYESSSKTFTLEAVGY